LVARLPAVYYPANKAAANMVQTSFSGDGAAGAGGTAAPGGREPDQPPNPAAPPAGAFGADVLAKMSHQLRSPLASITGLTRIMLVKAKTGQVDPAKLVQQLGMIQAGAHRSMATVERVLDAAKVELAAAAADFGPVDLCALVAEAAGTPDKIAEQRATVLCADIPLQPVMVATDPDILSRLLRELIDNALTFADATEIRVKLGTGTGPRQVLIEVSDDGAGITDQDQVRIFEAFERGSGAAQLDPDGIGMGLYLARKMADRLGADLSLSSRPGSGSTFTVTFADPGDLATPGSCAQPGG
jgi:two-component system sensor histidine kinase/response regulator